MFFCSVEYEEGKKWVKEELVFTKNKDVNFFEVTIRVLGALLTNYHFTGDEMFLDKAVSFRNIIWAHERYQLEAATYVLHINKAPVFTKKLTEKNVSIH